MEIPFDLLLAKIELQRNAFAGENARLAVAVDMLTAENAALDAENQALKAALEPKTGEAVAE
jgi:hypothetical protein